MNLSPYRHSNTGRIKDVREDTVVVNVSAGSGIGLMELPRSSCSFKPQVDDRVFLYINEDDGTYYLRKLPKTRQDKKKHPA